MSRTSPPPSAAAWLLLAALAAAALGQNDKETALLERELAEARLDLNEAERQLEDVYVRMESDYFQALTRLEERSASLARAIRRDADRWRAKLLEGRGGRSPSRNAQVLLLASHLGEAIAEAGFDPGFSAPLGHHLAPLLLDTVLRPDLPELESRLREALDRVFDPAAEFAQVWNDHLFRHVPAASAYASAHEHYMEVGRRLEVARSPDRFDDSGQRLPPGMVQVRRGTYTLGPQTGWNIKGFDRKTRKVSLPAFYIDRHEVTNAEYMIFYKQLPPEDQVRHRPQFWEKQLDGSYRFPEGTENHPVAGVSFNDAWAYATWAGKRLPTEDEWEAAARGQEGFLYPWGDEYEVGRANDRETGLGRTAPVESFPGGRSPVGCHDMAGNVEEWTATDENGDPVTGPLDSTMVLVAVRGGNYDAGADGVAATFRWVYPGLSTKRPQLGFRCAMDAGKKKR